MNNIKPSFTNVTVSQSQVKKQHQKPLTIQEQIENLKELGLIIKDEKSVANFLNDVSYFRFIKAFSIGLKTRNGIFYEGITFEHLQELYLFNANFRQLLFAQIEKIEVNLRCRLSNFFCLKYGVLGYLDSENFEYYPEKFSEGIQRDICNNSRSPFICNYQKNYEGGTIPLYALVEILSFGTISKLFKNMKAEDKKEFCKSYGISYAYFESWIENFTYVRNLCAHYGRIYNARMIKQARLYPSDTRLGICNTRIMGTLICLKHLLPNDRHWQEFVQAIASLLVKYPRVRKEALGFPCNWKEILLAEE